MSVLTFLDAAPPPPVGYAGWALVLISVFSLAIALIAGFILLVKRIKRRRANQLAGGGHSSGMTQANSPNQ